MNDNQNHRVREGWTSSRVIAPPGGGGSLMLGIAPPPRPQPAKENTLPKEENKPKEKDDKPSPAEASTKTTAAATAPTLSPSPTTTSTVTPTPATTPVAQCILPGLEAPTEPVSANAFASGANMNGAQVMTGRPTSRVRHPGGVGGPDSGWKLG